MQDQLPTWLQTAIAVAPLGTSLWIFITAVIALWQLRMIVRYNRFGGIRDFYSLLDESRAARTFVYTKLPVDPERLPQLPLNEIAYAEQAANFLNRLIYLLDQGIISRRMVLRMTHSMIIRLVFQLRSFLLWREQVLGTRWGRRILEFAEEAKDYHTICPLHRHTTIRLERTGELITVFEPALAKGIKGSLQNWWLDLRWFLKLY